jgi:hypothetical protein
MVAAKYEAMNQLAKALDGIATSVTSARMKESTPMRGMVH